MTTTKITGWTHNTDRGEWQKTVARGPGIYLTVVPPEDEEGELFWTVEVGDIDVADEKHLAADYSVQDAADAAVSELVDWMQNTATPTEMLEFVDNNARTGWRQTDMALTLGVSQPTISDWLAGKMEMSRAVRTHIMRICGITRRGSGRTAEWECA